jgi:hypothetical protein
MPLKRGEECVKLSWTRGVEGRNKQRPQLQGSVGADLLVAELVLKQGLTLTWLASVVPPKSDPCFGGCPISASRGVRVADHTAFIECTLSLVST